MSKILILSDTHGDNSWTSLAKDYDIVIHAGDHLNSAEFMQEHTNYYVDGNNDFGNNRIQVFNIDKFNVLLVHGDEYKIKSNYIFLWYEGLEKLAEEVDANIIIFGHTHNPHIEQVNGRIYINPGSYSRPRAEPKRSYCEAIINDNSIKAMIKLID